MPLSIVKRKNRPESFPPPQEFLAFSKIDFIHNLFFKTKKTRIILVFNIY